MEWRQFHLLLFSLCQHFWNHNFVQITNNKHYVFIFYTRDLVSRLQSWNHDLGLKSIMTIICVSRPVETKNCSLSLKVCSLGLGLALLVLAVSSRSRCSTSRFCFEPKASSTQVNSEKLPMLWTAKEVTILLTNTRIIGLGLGFEILVLLSRSVVLRFWSRLHHHLTSWICNCN